MLKEGKIFIHFSTLLCIKILIVFDAAYPTTFLQLLSKFQASIYIFLWVMAVKRRQADIFQTDYDTILL
jgi:hypothetical protein